MKTMHPSSWSKLGRKNKNCKKHNDPCENCLGKTNKAEKTYLLGRAPKTQPIIVRRIITKYTPRIFKRKDEKDE